MDARGRVAFAGAVSVGLLAVAGWLLGRPDTGAPVGAASPPAPAPPAVPESERPTRRPRRPTGPVAPPTVDGVPLAVGDEAALRKTYDPDARGLAQALVLRRDRLQLCWDEFLARTPEVDGRFTLRLSLAAGDTRAGVDVVNADFDAELEDCAVQALGDATFGPATQAQSLVYPVPVSG